MSWLPMGERPTKPGLYWSWLTASRREMAVVVLVNRLEGGDLAAFHFGKPESTPLADGWFDRRSFAPATPPPGWNLLEALEGNFNTHYEWELLKHETLRIARAYLAREEESPCPTA